MNRPQVVSAAEWQAARERLLIEEKEATRVLDALAAERRRLPMVEFYNDYAFQGPDGAASLLDLCEGRRQLIVYHFMLTPGANPCVGDRRVAERGHNIHGQAVGEAGFLASIHPSGWKNDSPKSVARVPRPP